MNKPFALRLAFVAGLTLWQVHALAAETKPAPAAAAIQQLMDKENDGALRAAADSL
jgi:hypothetical protein